MGLHVCTDIERRSGPVEGGIDIYPRVCVRAHILTPTRVCVCVRVFMRVHFRLTVYISTCACVCITVCCQGHLFFPSLSVPREYVCVMKSPSHTYTRISSNDSTQNGRRPRTLGNGSACGDEGSVSLLEVWSKKATEREKQIHFMAVPKQRAQLSYRSRSSEVSGSFLLRQRLNTHLVYSANPNRLYIIWTLFLFPVSLNIIM